MQKNEICVVIDNEEKKIVAIDILKRAKEKIWRASNAMDFDKESKYLLFSKLGDWYVAINPEKRKEISLEQLKQILNR